MELRQNHFLNIQIKISTFRMDLHQKYKSQNKIKIHPLRINSIKQLVLFLIITNNLVENHKIFYNNLLEKMITKKYLIRNSPQLKSI